ncbi:alpha/beta hydrolase family protein [Mycobacterium sp.]|uniref:alpha/beta hydrolase family protein n=1 Tax=Mycobacterium sp. TaxID=1785 RepID=UPI0031D293E8
MTSEPLRVDPEALAASARQLLASANGLPSPPAPHTVTGSDPLSQAIAAQAGKVETPITEGLPAAQKGAAGFAENLATAAQAYEQSDREIADRTRRSSFPDERDKVQAAGYGIKPQAPASGPLPGDMSPGDINAIDQTNRKLLDEMQQEYSKLPAGQVRTDRLADIAGIRDALRTPDSHLIFIAKPDDPSQMIAAATSIGDPFKADHVSVTVPGVSSSTRHSLATMTQEAYGLRQEAQFVAAHTPGESQNISTIAWMGYQPPPVIDSWDTVSDRLAQAGAPNLQSFLSDLNAGSHNPGHTTALFGHSYGSLLAGIALKEGASSDLTNVVLYGSPGFEATSPAQLGMSDSHLFVMSTPDDPIRPVGGLAPMHGWGADPNAIVYGDLDRYRFTHLETQAGTVGVGGDELNKTGASGHSEYGRDPLQRMTGYNLATILLNRPDLAARESLPPQ